MPVDQQQGYPAQLLEVLNTAVFLLDEKLGLVYLNPAAENLFQISRHQVMGQYWPKLVRADESVAPHLLEALSGQSPFTENELELYTAVKQRMTVNCTVTPISEGDLLLEITQVDRQLRIANDEQLLMQQRAAKELLRGLAHEIKNPLGGLRGAAQLLESELQQAELKEYTQVIIGEADRLRNLVNRMLGPNNVPDKQRVNIHQVLEQVRNLVEVEQHSGLTIERRYDPSLPELHADSDLLVQALLNLVQNAVQAGATHIVLATSAQRQFTIGHHRYKLVIRVDVIDNGSGIQPEMQEKIFYPMVTGRAEGTGLGLSIAQSLINEHEGIIEFTSEPGKSVFSIFLPLEAVND
jgi:two-component system nitrogen regulation sensor histidine kinase GlnL